MRSRPLLPLRRIAGLTAAAMGAAAVALCALGVRELARLEAAPTSEARP
ncbi:MAG: hypothetical protein R2726_14630 [Acidimicrobiales bacterium]